MKKICCYIVLSVFSLTGLLAQSVEQKEISTDSLPEKTIEIREIVIEENASKKVTGLSSGKISLHTDGLKSIPTMMGAPDVLKILELSPGVLTTGEGKSNIYVRGGDPGQTLLLYADIPIYTPGHALNIFPLFNADHLSTVELTKGGVNAHYGNLLSGLIASRTKTELPQKTSLKGNVGLLFSQATADVAINEKFGLYISGRASYTNILLKPFMDLTANKNGKNKLEDSLYDFYDSNITFVGQLSAENKLVIDGFIGRDVLNIIEDNIGVEGVLDWHNTAFSGKLETLWQNKILEQQIFYSGFQNKLDISLSDMNVKTLSTIRNAGYNSKLKYKLSHVPLESGIQYSFYQLFPQEFETIRSDFAFPDISFGRNDAHNISLFTSAKLNPIQALTLEPGLRYNFFHSMLHRINSDKNFHSVDFRFFGRYEYSSNQYFRATLSHTNQYISKLFPSNSGLPTDFWVAASSEISPQNGNEVSLGYYHILSGGMVELSSDIYYRTMSNVVEYNQNFIEHENSVFTERIYTGNGRAYGVEFMLKKNYGKFTGWLSYAFGRSERSFDEIDNGEVFLAKHDRTHDFSLTGTYVFNNKWDVSLTQVYASGNRFHMPTSWYFVNSMPVKEYGKYYNARMPNYNRTDISVNYWFRKDNGLNFSIYDVFVIYNPLYINLLVEQKENENYVSVSLKKRTLYTIIPSVSWRFKF